MRKAIYLIKSSKYGHRYTHWIQEKNGWTPKEFQWKDKNMRDTIEKSQNWRKQLNWKKKTVREVNSKSIKKKKISVIFKTG